MGETEGRLHLGNSLSAQLPIMPGIEAWKSLILLNYRGLSVSNDHPHEVSDVRNQVTLSHCHQKRAYSTAGSCRPLQAVVAKLLIERDTASKKERGENGNNGAKRESSCNAGCCDVCVRYGTRRENELFFGACPHATVTIPHAG